MQAGSQTWLTGLARSMTEEREYTAQLEGTLPPALQGTPYRNGPGRFVVGGMRKTHLLDGDGMIQALDFSDGKVRYRKHFGYFTTAPQATGFHNGLARLNMDTSQRDGVHLDDTHLGEPVFLPVNLG